MGKVYRVEVFARREGQDPRPKEVVKEVGIGRQGRGCNNRLAGCRRRRKIWCLMSMTMWIGWGRKVTRSGGRASNGMPSLQASHFSAVGLRACREARRARLACWL